RIAKDVMACECPQFVRAQGSCLTGDFNSIVEVRRKLSNPTKSDSFEIHFAEDARFTSDTAGNSPKQVRFDSRFWNDFRKRCVNSVQVVAIGSSIERPVFQVDHGSGERIDPIVLAAIARPDRIERSGGVGPVEMPDEPLLAEIEFLTANAKSEL